MNYVKKPKVTVVRKNADRPKYSGSLERQIITSADVIIYFTMLSLVT